LDFSEKISKGLAVWLPQSGFPKATPHLVFHPNTEVLKENTLPRKRQGLFFKEG
jgi:hypothetical protein